MAHGSAPYQLTPLQERTIRDTKVHDGHGEALGDEQFQQIVRSAIEEAETFVDSEDMAGERETALTFYRGGPMGNEVAGRSSIVMTEVHDVVNAMLPGIMRVFAGNEHVVEFSPVEENDTEQAKQATDYIDFVFMKDNDGFRNLYDLAYDGLIKKMGVVKWWHETKEEVFIEHYTGLDEQSVVKLMTDPDVEILQGQQTQGGQPQQGQY